MVDASVVASLERIIVGGVALTAVALARSGPGDLTLPQWRVMVMLDQPDATSGLTMSQIGHRLGVTLPATTRLVRRLSGRDIVAIGPDERDRRALRVRLTDRGRAVREEIVAHRRVRLQEIVGEIELTTSAADTLEEVARRFGPLASAVPPPARVRTTRPRGAAPVPEPDARVA